MNRWWCAWLALASISCGAAPIDPAKFEGVDRAARALRLELRMPVESGPAQTPALLDRLQREIAALNGRTNGRREAAVLDAYVTAAASCRDLLRFARLDREVVGGMVLLTGRNRPIALSAGLPTET